MGNKKKRGQERLLKKLQRESSNEVVPYTLAERERKITNIMIQLSQTSWEHLVPQSVRDGMLKFAKTGETYIDYIDMPQISRTLNVHFVNDKNKDNDNSINFLFNKVRVEGEEDNPINKLNKLQEDII